MEPFRSRDVAGPKVADRYRQSRKKEKKRILDEFTAASGYHRKHAIRVLGRKEDEKPARAVLHRPPRIYTPEVQKALETVWGAANRICSKRLIPYLPTFVESLERHGHVDLDLETRRRLLSMSAATADRILYSIRHAGATRPRSFPSGCPTLKAKIPVRTFDDWSEEGPGFLEADLVCHCVGNEGFG